MELSFLNELSLWDPLADHTQSTFCIADGNKEWAANGGHAPGSNPEDDGHLLLDQLEPFADDEFCNWMESKFDFDENIATLLDVEQLLMEENLLEENALPISLLTTSTSTREAFDQPETSNSSPSELVTSSVEDVPEMRDNITSSCVSELSSEAPSDGEVRVVRNRGRRGKRRGGTPYSRNPEAKTETKKCRKRSQNRDAASRYRIKKREESEVLAAEEAKLEASNEELNTRVENLSREINYLKNLMKELLSSRKSK